MLTLKHLRRYMAPELISCHEDLSRTGWGPEPDMWAVGCLTFWLLCGHTPFTASTIPKVLWNIERGRCMPFSSPYSPYISYKCLPKSSF